MYNHSTIFLYLYYFLFLFIARFALFPSCFAFLFKKSSTLNSAQKKVSP
ncbi:hypothetical protein HOLDEFILI_00712 [Holdemania filiformis DSM 12042]|uniref:Uncharacterized protein n=1 Tax=Holdemania filiformis DSM 12042 TaxID=545696 RepID=B9Y4I1_9FIRM|nr:hypothetical protein HOLDEFILI_00712 [Holdemania filiformis DSM 12042]